MSTNSTPRKKPTFPSSLIDLHRFRKTVHGHNGSSRIVMVRKTDQRTFASVKNGQEPKVETITRETIQTYRGSRPACKVTTERKNCEEKVPPDLIDILRTDKIVKKKVHIKAKNQTMESFREECLKTHNTYRSKHGVHPLKLNKDMCIASQNWADHLIRTNTIAHSDNNQYGENIYAMESNNSNCSVKGKDAVDKWYGEIKVHTFGVEPRGMESGHFTQVVWQESKELGVGYAKSGGKCIVVANYYPPGNYVGQYVKNVHPISAITSIIDGISKLTTKKKESIDTHQFEKDFLKAHNHYRALHGVPALQLDRKMCKYSEEWAKHLASKNTLEHRPNNNYGENVFCISSNDPDLSLEGNVPVDEWYKEAKNHCFDREPSGLGTGHFTQVVWKNSEDLGVGIAKAHNRIYVVANYSPAGNFVGQFVKNVLPTSSSPSPYPDDSPPELPKSCPPTRSKTVGSEYFNEFQLEGLQAHNEYRRKHGVPEMTLSKEMCDCAQFWAHHCADQGNMSHSHNNKYGENIYYAYSSDLNDVLNARTAVKRWYDEVKGYNFGVESVQMDCLHFTQIVWKESTELGIAKATNKKGETYVVANYNHKGNFIGQFKDNVFKARQ